VQFGVPTQPLAQYARSCSCRDDAVGTFDDSNRQGEVKMTSSPNDAVSFEVVGVPGVQPVGGEALCDGGVHRANLDEGTSVVEGFGQGDT